MDIEINHNTDERVFLLESLKYILSLAETDTISVKFFEGTGICNVVDELHYNSPHYYRPHYYRGAWRIMNEAFKTWPEFSGSVSFPIPSDDDETPMRYYMDCENLWQGRQLEKRISLLKHMIKVI